MVGGGESNSQTWVSLPAVRTQFERKLRSAIRVSQAGAASVL